MGLFGKFKKEEAPQVVEVGGYQSFSTPFLKMPQGDLSLPFVDARYQSRDTIPFGSDNLYPQHLNQLYFSSPLHSSITNFKVNAVCGGGYELLDENMTAKEKVDLFAFERKVGFRKHLKPTLLDLMLRKSV